MKKTVFFVRHANADEGTNNQKDFDRPLSASGHRQAPKIAVKMKYDQEVPDVIISSPAKRALETATYFYEHFDFSSKQVLEHEDLYDASTGTLLNIINNLPEDYSKVYLVGHNPGFTYITEYLTGEEIGSIPTTGIVKIDFELDKWELVSKDSGQLIFHIYPKMFGY